jgi:hypothetical protein
MQHEVEAVKNVATKDILTLFLCVKCNRHWLLSFYVPESILLVCVSFRVVLKWSCLGLGMLCATLIVFTFIEGFVSNKWTICPLGIS